VKITTPVLAKPLQFQTGSVLVKDGAARGNFSATLDAMRATGTVGVSSLSPLSIIKFAIALPHLDIAQVQHLVIPKSGMHSAPGATQHLMATGTVAVDRIDFFPFEATGMRGRLSVYGNMMSVDSYALSAYGGTVQGGATLNYSRPGLPLAVTTTMRGIDVKQLSTMLSSGAEKLVTGTLAADLGLATDMGADFKKTLRGAGSFAVRNGSFPTLDLKDTVEKLAALQLVHASMQPTKFSYLGGDIRIAQQRVYSNALQVDAENLTVTARGSFGFDKTLEYLATGAVKFAVTQTITLPLPAGAPSFVGQILRTYLPATSGATGVRVPFSVRGSFDKPEFSLAGTPQPITKGP
jgi:hypothetical protein